MKFIGKRIIIGSVESHNRERNGKSKPEKDAYIAQYLYVFRWRSQFPALALHIHYHVNYLTFRTRARHLFERILHHDRNRKCEQVASCVVLNSSFALTAQISTDFNERSRKSRKIPYFAPFVQNSS